MTALPGFALVAAAIVMAPGLSFVFFLSTWLRYGRTPAAAAVSGIALGALMLGTFTAAVYPVFGSALEHQVRLVRVGGGAYLVWLGLKELLPATRRALPAITESVEASRRILIIRGIMLSLVNPGLFVLYVVILPQYVTPTPSWRASALMLVVVHVVIVMCWYGSLLALAEKGRRHISSAGGQRVIRATAAGIFLLLGLQMIFESGVLSPGTTSHDRT
jgi:threonine/homoserine/homoserine lactone efflux protein